MQAYAQRPRCVGVVDLGVGVGVVGVVVDGVGVVGVVVDGAVVVVRGILPQAKKWGSGI